MVLLRQFSANDAPLLVTFLNNPMVTRYVTAAIPQPYSIDDAMWWIAHSQASNLIKAIEYQGEFVGCISAQRGDFEYNRSAEIGYWLAQPFWSKGIMTKAVNLFCDQLYKETDLARLSVSVVTNNIASCRVLEKNGFGFEGKRKAISCKNGEFFDENMWAKLCI